MIASPVYTQQSLRMSLDRIFSGRMKILRTSEITQFIPPWHPRTPSKYSRFSISKCIRRDLSVVSVFLLVPVSVLNIWSPAQLQKPVRFISGFEILSNSFVVFSPQKRTNLHTINPKSTSVLRSKQTKLLMSDLAKRADFCGLKYVRR